MSRDAFVVEFVPGIPYRLTGSIGGRKFWEIGAVPAWLLVRMSPDLEVESRYVPEVMRALEERDASLPTG